MDGLVYSNSSFLLLARRVVSRLGQGRFFADWGAYLRVHWRHFAGDSWHMANDAHKCSVNRRDAAVAHQSSDPVAVLREIEVDLQRLGQRIHDLADRMGIPIPSHEPWIDIAQAANYASCSTDLLRDLIRQGSLPVGRIGRAIRVRRSDIDHLLLGGQGSDMPSARNAEDSQRIAEKILHSMEH